MTENQIKDQESTGAIRRGLLIGIVAALFFFCFGLSGKHWSLASIIELPFAGFIIGFFAGCMISGKTVVESSSTTDWIDENNKRISDDSQITSSRNYPIYFPTESYTSVDMIQSPSSYDSDRKFS